MSRLTNTVREQIRRKAVAAAFKERIEVRKLREQALAMECYAACLPEAERTAAAAMPERWLRQDACLRFNANGWSVTLHIEKAVPVPYSMSCYRLGDLTGELAERVQAHAQEERDLNEASWKASAELDGFLSAFKSFKQLRESWPEGEAFYAELDVDRPASGLPAVRVAEINKLLNLEAA